MIVTPHFIILRLQKTASTSILHILKKCLKNQKIEHIGVHHGIFVVDELEYKDKLIISSFRNPFYWYRSWWAFSNYKKQYGRQLAYNKIEHDDIKLFQKYMLKLKNNNNYLSKFAKKRPRIYRHDIGLLTHMYLNMYFKNQYDLINIDFSKFQKYDNKHCCVNKWIFVENFINDMTELLNSFNMLTDEISYLIKNTHIRYNEFKPLEEYYTQEIVDYVEQRDKFILQKFNYSFPIEN